MPQPPLQTAPLYNKPTPPTPTEPENSTESRGRSVSIPSGPNGRYQRRREPIRLDDHVQLSRLSMLIETNNVREIEKLASPEITGSFDTLIKRSRAEKIKQLTGSEDAWVSYQAAVTKLPWYLKPEYSEELQMDNEGQVRTGTIRALVEKLTSEPLTKDPISESC